MAQPSQNPSKSELDFYRRLCTARFFEGIVGAILELSGYVVFPLGYEQFMPVLRHLFRENQAQPVPAEERLRSSPDLLVVGQTSGESDVIPRLVEVKYRNWHSPTDVRLSDITLYQHHWQDAILVVVLPAGDGFYAQEITQIDGRKRTFDLTQHFQRLDALFPHVKPQTLQAFGEDVQRFTDTR